MFALNLEETKIEAIKMLRNKSMNKDFDTATYEHATLEQILQFFCSRRHFNDAECRELLVSYVEDHPTSSYTYQEMVDLVNNLVDRVKEDNDVEYDCVYHAGI